MMECNEVLKLSIAEPELTQNLFETERQMTDR